MKRAPRAAHKPIDPAVLEENLRRSRDILTRMIQEREVKGLSLQRDAVYREARELYNLATNLYKQGGWIAALYAAGKTPQQVSAMHKQDKKRGLVHAAEWQIEASL